MNQIIKIIQTPVRFYPEIGGVENHVYYLGKELSKKQIAVEVICAGDKNLPNKKDGMQVTRLSSSFKITNTNITLSLPFVLFKSEFDLIHTHMPTPWTADWSVLIAKLKKKKSIITIHNDLQKNGFIAKVITDIYLNSIFLLTLSLVDKIIVVNPDWEESFVYTKNLLKRFKKKIVVIPNGVDTDLFKPSVRKDKATVLFVSVLDKYHIFKGFDYLLKALPKIYKAIPEFKLQVIGEGELKSVYQNAVQKLGLQKQVLFLGEKVQKELPHYFSKASVFVLPSIHTEGYGIVLLEALSSKTPVVTTTIAGLSTDIKKCNAGSVVAPSDEKALADALIQTLKSQVIQKKQGDNGRELIEKKYSWEKVSNDIAKLYKEALS